MAGIRPVRVMVIRGGHGMLAVLLGRAVVVAVGGAEGGLVEGCAEDFGEEAGDGGFEDGEGGADDGDVDFKEGPAVRLGLVVCIGITCVSDAL